MTATTASQLDFTAPPVVKTIGQRSLIVGGVFAIVSVILAFTRPDEFCRGYLLGFMCWLGVSLGSMAVLMIRHLTGGGWGMVIRRIMGASMRTLPLLTILFVPMIIAVAQHRIYPWAMPLTSVQDEHIREHLAKNKFITEGYLNLSGYWMRAIIYFAIWNLCSFLLSKWSRQTDRVGAPDNTQKFKAVAGPGLILYGFTITFAAIDWVMSLDPSWISTIFCLIILIGEVLSAMCFAVVIERIPRSRQVDAYLHHALGLFQLLAMAHHLGRRPARRNHFLSQTSGWRLGIHRADSGALPFLRSVRNPALATVQARHSQTGVARGLADPDALR